jgi:hypothetical protein
VATDSTVQAALDAWRSCMRTMGLEYTDPHAALTSIAGAPDHAIVSLVAADRTCKDRSQLAATYGTVWLQKATEAGLTRDAMEQAAGILGDTINALGSSTG